MYYTEMIYLIILRVPCAESCTRDPSTSSLSDVWPCAVVYVWLVRYWSLIIFIYGARGGCNFVGRGGKIELTFWMHGKPFFFKMIKNIDYYEIRLCILYYTEIHVYSHSLNVKKWISNKIMLTPTSNTGPFYTLLGANRKDKRQEKNYMYVLTKYRHFKTTTSVMELKFTNATWSAINSWRFIYSCADLKGIGLQSWNPPPLPKFLKDSYFLYLFT